ncbi:MAG TPA: FliM/FliN family flagellar motor switch protein [Dyella sp.]|uniref:FliM/FliN family flagellar motor switch protein n=1 Tax=Dyella sp. TaxID=1869338 RepID=UPI002CFB5141|nr:FliM/FliN family flagellar motor switch protein [Dyella sp.]HTV87277.1 FliM/FliN family flagellar motor switch protein [Dyella sp.]
MNAPIALRHIDKQLVGLRNTLAGARITTKISPSAGKDRPVLTLDKPLPAYALQGEYSASCGSLYIGLEVGAIDPAYAPDVVARVARTDAALHDWLDWMLSPWLDALEKHLGTTFSLQTARTGAALPEQSLAFRLACQTANGHIGFAGSALGHIDWRQLVRTERGAIGYSWLTTNAYTLVHAGTFPVRALRTLSPGAMLRLAGFACALHVGDLKKGLRMPLRRMNKEEKMEALDSQDMSTWDMAVMPPDAEATSVSLEDVTLPVDVVIDRRALTLGQVEQLRRGSVYVLAGVSPGKSVALCCNGHTFALGELVSVEDQWAVLITECRGEPA